MTRPRPSSETWLGGAGLGPPFLPSTPISLHGTYHPDPWGPVCPQEWHLWASEQHSRVPLPVLLASEQGKRGPLPILSASVLHSCDCRSYPGVSRATHSRMAPPESQPHYPRGPLHGGQTEGPGTRMEGQSAPAPGGATCRATCTQMARTLKFTAGRDAFLSQAPRSD